MVNEGYRLGMRGERVSELLARQFVVPTLQSVPNNTTKTWIDGEYVVEFRIGELCRVKEQDEWQFYRLIDLTNVGAIWEKANASELPDMSNYYTKEEVDKKVEEHKPNLDSYYTKEETDKEIEDKFNEIQLPDMGEYYTKEEADVNVDAKIAKIEFPEDESIKNVTQEEYDAMYEADTLSDKTMYFISKDGTPIALHIGKVQIAVREEGSKGFAYNFPITF